MPNQSFVIAVISPERKIHQEIASALESSSAEALWAFHDYPDPGHLAQIREATRGCVVLIDFSDFSRASAIAAEIDVDYPLATVVALLAPNDSQQLVDLMRLGVREVVPFPVAAEAICRAVTRAGSKLMPVEDAHRAGGQIFAFMSAKPGAGGTTVASHAAAAAARLSNQRTLLLDFDLRLGMISFLFKLHGETSVLDALHAGRALEVTLWDRAVCRRGMLDILGSAPPELTRDMPEEGAPFVLEFAKQMYSTICIDLPGEMRFHEQEALRRARAIFLVCAPDLGTLHIAKRKAALFRSLDLHHKVSVIMNRADGRNSVSHSDVEDILELPVRFTISSAEKDIANATEKGVPLDGRSSVVTQIENVARHMMPVSGPPGASKARRFSEFFSVTPVRDRMARN